MTAFLTRVEIQGDRYPERRRYPFNIGCLGGRHVLSFSSDVAFFVGENGSGKSTFMKALAWKCDAPLWGQPQRARQPGELPVSALGAYLETAFSERPPSGGFFSAEGFREWAEFLDDVARMDPGQAKYHGGPELTARSHGEGILGYFRGRYRHPGLYFLDEPESALSPASQIELLRLLDECRRSGHAQFLIATHSPILIALPGSQLFHFAEGTIAETHYEATGHFQLYRNFLADPGSFLE